MITLLIAASLVSPAPNVTEAIASGIKYQLKDPDSARFRNFRMNAEGDFCVEVNARNEYGGYTGFQTWRGKLRENKIKLHAPNFWGNGVMNLECNERGL
jgi:hypothetical protein